jgi:squalene synthase HpnC
MDNPAVVSIEHYENFPVASYLCARELRPAIVAIYHFARTADDIADEGDATPQARRAALRDYRADLDAVLAGRSPSDRWPRVFGALAHACRRHALPPGPLHSLLDAFEHDTGNPRYRDRAELLAYCQNSANPIGRLLLHLYGVTDTASLRLSDAICSALQLINFWQDLGVDLARGRVYLPEEDARRQGVDLAAPSALRDTPATATLVRELCEWTNEMMLLGAPLACRLAGRAGWELRFVVQGGLRVLEKIRRMGYATIGHRPALCRRDGLPIAWHAWSMCRGAG